MIYIRYISALCSNNLLQYIFETSREKPQLAAQKFHRLLTEGLASLGNECQVETFSTVPVTRQNHSRIWWNISSEKENGVVYRYIPMVNLPVFKNLLIFIGLFISNLYWLLRTNRKQRFLVCDALNLTVSLASIVACWITGGKCIGIVTDIPGMMVVPQNQKVTIKGNIYRIFSNAVISRFSGYLLLTEAMSEVVNPNQKPYMIMEGLVDVKMAEVENILKKKKFPKVILYGGGLFARYGVENLVLAFMKTPARDVELHLYGSGEMEDDLKEYMAKDKRIFYHGLVPTDQVVEAQLKASLLVNPRPSSQDFTRFSFPSKNMEYMASGTPMITTPLPGMPDEYKPFVFLFEKENPDNMAKALTRVIDKNRETLHEFGKQAKAFVMKNKNNQVQARRLYEFCQSL